MSWTCDEKGSFGSKSSSSMNIKTIPTEKFGLKNRSEHAFGPNPTHNQNGRPIIPGCGIEVARGNAIIKCISSNSELRGPPHIGSRSSRTEGDSLRTSSLFDRDKQVRQAIHSVEAKAGTEVSGIPQSSRRPAMRSTPSLDLLNQSDPHHMHKKPESQSRESGENISLEPRKSERKSTRQIIKYKEPETVDLLSDDDCKDEEVVSDLISVPQFGTRKSVPAQRIALISAHFGLLEVKTSQEEGLCTLSLMGTSHEMAWRFNWYARGREMIIDLRKDDIVAFREFEDNESGNFFIALEIRGQTRLDKIPVGTNFILNPTSLEVNEVDKYIILTMPGEQHTKWRKELAHYPHLANIEKRNRSGYKLWANHKTREHMPFSVLEDRIEKELSEMRKFRRRGAGASYDEDPTDNETFVIYPIEPQAPDAVTISKGDMKRLEPGVYFNDNLIDLEIKHLLADLEEKDPDSRDRIHAFSCLFYSKLTEKNEPDDAHTLVKKWTKNVDLFKMRYILFPINIANHWSLMVLARPDLLVNLEDTPQNQNSPELNESTAMDVIDDTGMESSPTISNQENFVGNEFTNHKSGHSSVLSDGHLEKSSSDIPCFLHLDSLRLHSSERIKKVLAGYMFFERERKYRPMLLRRQQQELRPLVEEGMDKKDFNGGKAESAYVGTEDRSQSQSSIEGALNETKDGFSNDDTAPYHNKEVVEAIRTCEIAKPTDDEILFNTPSEPFASQQLGNDSIIPGKKIVRSRSNPKLKGNSNNRDDIQSRMKRFVKCIKVVPCDVPTQHNSYDCGVFVIRFAEMIIKKGASTTTEDIRNKMQRQFVTEFSQKDIVGERERLKEFLKSIQPEWETLRKEWLKKQQEEGKDASNIEAKEEDDESNAILLKEEAKNASSIKAKQEGDKSNAFVAAQTVAATVATESSISGLEGSQDDYRDELNIPSSRCRNMIPQQQDMQCLDWPLRRKIGTVADAMMPRGFDSPKARCSSMSRENSNALFDGVFSGQNTSKNIVLDNAATPNSVIISSSRDKFYCNASSPCRGSSTQKRKHDLQHAADCESSEAPQNSKRSKLAHSLERVPQVALITSSLAHLDNMGGTVLGLSENENQAISDADSDNSVSADPEQTMMVDANDDETESDISTPPTLQSQKFTKKKRG